MAVKPPHGSVVLKKAGGLEGVEIVEGLEEVMEDVYEGVGGVARVILWGLFVVMLLWVVVRGMRKREVKVDKVVGREELLGKMKIQEVDQKDVEEKRKKPDVTEHTTAGRTNSLKTKPGSWVTVTDDMSPANGKSLKVLRTDGEDIECEIPNLGGVVFNTQYLKKTPVAVEVKWKVHGMSNPTEITSGTTRVDPFGACSEVFYDVAAKLHLKQYQFHLISGGKKINPREMANTYCDPTLFVKVFVIKESLKPGYRPPVAADPGHAEKIYSTLQQKCDEIEGEMLGDTIPPVGVQSGDSTDLADFIKKYDKVVVDFYAPWCGPCRMIAPHFRALGASPSHSKIGFFTIDADANRRAAATHGIRSFPTIQTFIKGVLYETMKGADTRRLETLVENLDRA